MLSGLVLRFCSTSPTARSRSDCRLVFRSRAARVRLVQALSSGELPVIWSSLSRYSLALSTRFWPK